MKKAIITIGLLLQIISLAAQTIDSVSISGIYRNAPLKMLLEDIRSKKIPVYYKDIWIDTINIQKEFHKIPLVSLFDQLSKETNIQYSIVQDAVYIFPKKSAVHTQTFDTEIEVLTIGDPLNQGRYPTVTLKGHIIDGANGEKLVGAVIYSVTNKIGVSTDMNGEFEINLPSGQQTLKISFIGFEEASKKIRLFEDGNVDFELFEETHGIDEVTIVASQTRTARAQMSMVTVNPKIMKELPILMGEADVIKSIVLMPGVQSVGELSSGFNVRGGNSDQNLVLLGGAPVFNTSHLFGLFSMINPGMVQNITLFKGGIPASYGERVSSVMDIEMKDGNNKQLKLYGGLGIINSRVTLEGPYAKDKKSTFIVGARSTYSNWLLNSTKDAELTDSDADFYDVCAKTNLFISPKNSIELMGYHSFDKINLQIGSHYKYLNTLGAFHWKYNISDHFFSDINLAYSNYYFQIDETNSVLNQEHYSLGSGIEYKSGKWNLNYLFSEKHSLKLGAKIIVYKINPGEIKPKSQPSFIVPEKVNNDNAIETGLYIEDEFDLFDNLTLNLGLRYSTYTSYGPSTYYLFAPDKPLNKTNATGVIEFKDNEIAKRFKHFEPRLSIKYKLNSGANIIASYQKLTQYINQVSNSSVMAPTDYWKSSDYYIEPLESEQYALGFFKGFSNVGIEMSSEVYYKTLINIPEFKNGAKLFMNHHIETALLQADGYSYGLELHVKKPSGRVNGWLSYSYSRTMRQADGKYQEEIINKGKYYPSVYDKPHDLSIVTNFQISRRWRLSGNFILNSGRPITLPELKYDFDGLNVAYYSDRNKYRMPSYHRLDLSITLDENLRKKRMWKGSWTFSIYNIYGRKNTYSVYYKRDFNYRNQQHGLFDMYKLSIIGVPIPSLTYNFIF